MTIIAHELRTLPDGETIDHGTWVAMGQLQDTYRYELGQRTELVEVQHVPGQGWVRRHAWGYVH